VSFRNGSGLKAAVTVLEARKNVGIGNAASSKPPPDNSQVIRVTLTGACANAMPKQGVNRDDSSLGLFETQRQAANALLIEEGGP
jgi:hypothetical protein